MKLTPTPTLLLYCYIDLVEASGVKLTLSLLHTHTHTHTLRHTRRVIRYLLFNCSPTAVPGIHREAWTTWAAIIPASMALISSRTQTPGPGPGLQLSTLHRLGQSPGGRGEVGGGRGAGQAQWSRKRPIKAYSLSRAWPHSRTQKHTNPMNKWQKIKSKQ